MEVVVEQYNGYELNDTVYSWDLSDRERKTLDMCAYLVDNKLSIRKTCKEFMLSKSELHRRIHSVCRETSYELYCCVARQLMVNKRKYFK